MARLACACRIRWRGRLVWVPPTGRPYFVDTNPAQDFTEQEWSEFCAEFGSPGDAEDA